MTVAPTTHRGLTRRLRISPQNVVRVLIAAVAVAMLLVSHAASAAVSQRSGQDGRVTFGIQPAATQGMDPRSYFSIGATPGATVSDDAVVLNFSTHALRLNIYATDAITIDGGGLGLLQREQKPVDAGSWITLGSPAPNVVVPARTSQGPGQVVVPVSVQVPVNAAPGDHVAGIIASLTTVSTTPGGTNVKLQQRVASRVYVRVTGALAPELTISDVRVHYHGGLLPTGASATITYTLTNSGNVKLGGIPSVEVSSIFGTTESAHDIGPVPLLLPGGQIHLSATVDAVPPLGPMTARVVVAPVSVTGDQDPSMPVAVGSTHFWAVPWLLVLLALAAVAGGAWWLRRRRRVPAGPEPDESVDAREPVNA
jgi:hypothetical protein